MKKHLLSYNCLTVYTFAFALFLCLLLTSCGGASDHAAVDAESWEVGLGFGSGSPGDFVNPPDGYGDLCKVYDTRAKAASVVVKIYYVEADGTEVNIYPPQKFVDGVDFSNGIPQGFAINIPTAGKFLMKIMVFGKKDDTDCCGDDEIPYWEQIWPYHENKIEHYAYIAVPRFQLCIPIV